MIRFLYQTLCAPVWWLLRVVIAGAVILILFAVPVAVSTSVGDGSGVSIGVGVAVGALLAITFLHSNGPVSHTILRGRGTGGHKYGRN